MTDAMLYTIESRSGQDAEHAHLSQFSLNMGQAVSSQIIIDESHWTPYCLDHLKREMVFVELPSDVDLSEAVFVYATQFQTARRVLVVPYESLEQLAEQIDLPENNTFIFSLPRSGTTLVSRMFNELESVWSLSEPDIFTDLSLLAATDADKDEITHLVKISVKLMFRPQKEVNRYVLKFRSQALFIAEQFYKAFPVAQNLFLYRDGLSFAGSFYRFARKLDVPAVINREISTNLWQALVVAPDISGLETLIQHDVDSLPLEVFFAAMYIRQCERYTETIDYGVPYCAVRYNELNQNRESELARIVAHCNLPEDALTRMMRAFNKDSQAGTAIARDVDMQGFTEEQTSRCLATMAQHPIFNDPNRLL